MHDSGMAVKNANSHQPGSVTAYGLPSCFTRGFIGSSNPEIGISRPFSIKLQLKILFSCVAATFRILILLPYWARARGGRRWRSCFPETGNRQPFGVGKPNTRGRYAKIGTTSVFCRIILFHPYYRSPRVWLMRFLRRGIS